MAGAVYSTAQPLTSPRGFRIPGNRRRHFHERYRTGRADSSCSATPPALSIPFMGTAWRSLPAVHLPSTPDFAVTASTATLIASNATSPTKPTLLGDGDPPGPAIPDNPRAAARPGARLQQRFLDRVTRAATGCPAVAAAQLDVYTLSPAQPPAESSGPLGHPCWAPRRPARSEPPLTVDERPTSRGRAPSRWPNCARCKLIRHGADGSHATRTRSGQRRERWRAPPRCCPAEREPSSLGGGVLEQQRAEGES